MISLEIYIENYWSDWFIRKHHVCYPECIDQSGLGFTAHLELATQLVEILFYRAFFDVLRKIRYHQLQNCQKGVGTRLKNSRMTI